MLLWLTTFLFGLVSALVPFLPIEFEIIGTGALKGGTSEAIALGAAAGLGATVGKVVWYQLALHGSKIGWASRKLASSKVRAVQQRWVDRLAEHPVWAGVVIFVSAFLGIPPLLAMSAVAGFLRMPLWVFVPTVAVGRSMRFSLLYLGVDLAVH